MHRRQILMTGTALLATCAAATVVPEAVASGSLPKVTVRIEGKTKTLLAASSVQTRSGSITKGGAPSGACPSASAQGALDVATKGKWSGTYSSKYQEYFITKILGDSETSKTAYWEIFVNNVAASTGACQIKLKSGDQLLFAVVPSSPTEYPIGLKAPKTATAGKAFKVTVLGYDAKGKATPLAGATVTAGSQAQTSSASGVVTLTDAKAGTLTVQAGKTGYVRDETGVNVK